MSEDRWALIVGASRGLGLGLAAELQRRGWNIVVTMRDAAGERRLQKPRRHRPARLCRLPRPRGGVVNPFLQLRR
jgi:NAD(P)-dependent dehydrogenase (short-subunit alcohol dehydrogenase family)